MNTSNAPFYTPIQNFTPAVLTNHLGNKYPYYQQKMGKAIKLITDFYADKFVQKVDTLVIDVDTYLYRKNTVAIKLHVVLDELPTKEFRKFVKNELHFNSKKGFVNMERKNGKFYVTYGILIPFQKLEETQYLIESNID